MPSPRALPARLPVALSPNPRRIVEAVLFLIGEAERRGKAVTQYDLVKSIFLADRSHLNRYGRPITFDNYYAMKHGPVPSFVYGLLREDAATLDRAGLRRLPWHRRDTGKSHFVYEKPQRPADRDVLSESDVEALTDALGTVLALGFAQVRRLTHEDPAYVAAWDDNAGKKRFPMDYGLLFDEPDPARARELAFASAHL
jgi:hypothetical protein